MSRYFTGNSCVGNPRLHGSIHKDRREKPVCIPEQVKALVLGDGMVSWLGELLSEQARADFVLQI